jgi:hypothetical protein
MVPGRKCLLLAVRADFNVFVAVGELSPIQEDYFVKNAEEAMQPGGIPVQDFRLDLFFTVVWHRLNCEVGL